MNKNGYLTRITNDKLERFGLNLSRWVSDVENVQWKNPLHLVSH